MILKFFNILYLFAGSFMYIFYSFKKINLPYLNVYMKKEMKSELNYQFLQNSRLGKRFSIV
jgi:hypothetical protein